MVERVSEEVHIGKPLEIDGIRYEALYSGAGCWMVRRYFLPDTHWRDEQLLRSGIKESDAVIHEAIKIGSWA